MIKKVAFFGLIGLLWGACTRDRVIPIPISAADCTEAVNYTNQVGPIIQQNCSTSGCHDATASGGYEFSSYSDVSLSAETILKAMKHEAGILPMPYDQPKLADSVIRKFECWMLQGKPEN